ncbi:MAG: hypothetical protein ACM3YO_00495 [Bacteroidota bacterium]
MSINNDPPKWLRDLNRGLDSFNRELNKVSQAVSSLSQTTVATRDSFVSSASTAPVSTPDHVRFTMDNQGKLHTAAFGLIDISLDPDSFFNGEYTQQARLETQPDGSKKVTADFKILGLFNCPVESKLSTKAKNVDGIRIDFRGQKTMDVQADLQFLGIKLPIRTILQARRMGNGQYRFYTSSAVCNQTRIPNFIANFCLWLAAKTNGLGGISLSGTHTFDMNIPQFLASQGMYGN